MGFFKTFAALCSGTSVFIELLNAKLGRAIFHAVIMILTAACIVTLGAGYRNAKAVDEGVRNFEASCGALSLTHDSVSTKLHDTPLFETGDFAFINLSGKFLNNAPEIVRDSLDRPKQYNIYCFDSGFLFVMAGGGREGGFSAQFIPAGGLYEGFSGKGSAFSIYKDFSSQQYFTDIRLFTTYLDGLLAQEKARQANTSAAQVESADSVAVTQDAMKQLVSFAVATSAFIMTLKEAILMFLLCSFSFSVAEMYRMAPLKDKIKFKNIYVVTVYAMFPPFAIAALYAAFDLPFFSFQITFLIAFMIYHLTGFNGILRHFLPPPPPPDENDYDDDF